MSPWVNVETGAERIGKDFVFSRKPAPALLAHNTWEPEIVENDLRDSALPIEISVDELTARFPELDPEALEGADLVIGATTPSVSDAAFPITGGTVSVTYTTEDAGDVLFYVNLDASTLAEPLPGELAGRDLSLDYRLVHTEPSVMEHLWLTVPSVIEAGTELHATAAAVDAYGNRVPDVEMEVDILGPHGTLLTPAPVAMELGRADFRILPVATIPQVDGVYNVMLVTTDGVEVNGYELQGSGISRDSTVFLNGTSFPDQGIVQTIPDNDTVWFGLPDWASLSGEHSFVVVNPGEQSSSDFAVTF